MVVSAADAKRERSEQTKSTATSCNPHLAKLASRAVPSIFTLWDIGHIHWRVKADEMISSRAAIAVDQRAQRSTRGAMIFIALQNQSKHHNLSTVEVEGKLTCEKEGSDNCCNVTVIGSSFILTAAFSFPFPLSFL